MNAYEKSIKKNKEKKTIAYIYFALSLFLTIVLGYQFIVNDGVINALIPLAILFGVSMGIMNLYYYKSAKKDLDDHKNILEKF